MFSILNPRIRSFLTGSPYLFFFFFLCVHLVQCRTHVCVWVYVWVYVWIRLAGQLQSSFGQLEYVFVIGLMGYVWVRFWYFRDGRGFMGNAFFFIVNVVL